MHKRPCSITVISWLFIAIGVMALFGGMLPLAQRMTEFKQHPFGFGLIQVVRILAIIAGAFMLCGFNWARWLMVVWLTFHVILSAFHSPVELMIHTLLFVVVAYFLFRAPARDYFHAARAAASTTPKKDEGQVD
jgi:hypothetical protein